MSSSPLAKLQNDLRIVYNLQQRTVRVRLYTTRINGDGFDLRPRPGVPTIQSITHLQPEPDRDGLAEIYGIYAGYLSCSIVAEIYSGCIPRSVITGICSGSFPCSVTGLASQPTLSHLTDLSISSHLHYLSLPPGATQQSQLHSLLHRT